MVETIETGRLILRSLRASDAGPMTLYSSDPRVACMTTSIPHPYPPGAAATYIERAVRRGAPDRAWAIDATPIGGAELVGVILLKRGCDIGYWVGPPYWNTGYASEALTALVRHLLAEPARNVLRAEVFLDNPASARVLERAGFVACGMAERHSVARGKATPARLYRLDRATLPAGAAAEETAG